jgi:hypothetical protein
MAKERRMVQYGHQEQDLLKEKGTLLVLDAFDGFDEEALRLVLEVAETRRFARVVLFPHQDKTLKPMGLTAEQSFALRLRGLQELVAATITPVHVSVDRYEEKRKKYTPLELIVRHAEDKYPSPLFLFVSETYANAIAGFASFEECIRRVRLLLHGESGRRVHPRLDEYEKRWDYI